MYMYYPIVFDKHPLRQSFHKLLPSRMFLVSLMLIEAIVHLASLDSFQCETHVYLKKAQLHVQSETQIFNTNS